MKNGDSTSAVLTRICRELFCTYGVPDEVSSDGGPQFTAHEFDQLLKTRGVQHRLSSCVEYPQSNGREIGVIRYCTSSNGDFKAVAVILQYRNTPLPDTNLSPA